MSQTYEESVHMMLCQYVLYKNLFVWFERKEPVLHLHVSSLNLAQVFMSVPL